MNALLTRVGKRALISVPLAEAYTGRANSFGFLRLLFALSVVLAHSSMLGYAHPLPVPVDLGALAVAGFFAISGFLITRSARRSSVPRYLWHRALRIFPGLWGVLLFTAFVMAPAMWYHAHGTIHGVLRAPGGAVDYVRNNWLTGFVQPDIGLLLIDTPYGRFGKVSQFNGSLWTLHYEMACYLIVAVLAALMILRNARRLVLLFGVLVFGVLVWNSVAHLRFGHAPVWTDGDVNPFPVLGPLLKPWFLWYGFMFLMGALAELYADRLPINDLLGVVSLGVLAWFAGKGELLGPALLLYAYVILWLAVRLPRALHWVGRRNDYSYGIYIYAFPLQQVMAKFGVPSVGRVGYFLAGAVSAFVCAYVSWHLVEKQALKLKGWTPRPWRRDVPTEAAQARFAAQAPAPAVLHSRAELGPTAVPEPIGP